MTDDTEFDEAEAALSAAGWSISGIVGSTDGVTLTFVRDSTPEHREIATRQKFGKTGTEAVRAFLKELANERGAG